ncbi:HEAT repeat domain-containing protein [Alkalinema sp. FACHB-956]|uniref:HEAT repeat domain-containing protein n=1 Tax=Alkalinema sp. FACHB-956 TaxID=2692768 RepID=UPI001684D213|nr:HEAT repeat domain-containing protein [Alkalinema sp. FACHB-956]MBD2328110.1 HEAT repeat domain-containing protein [Alkalinema sp. FACHB-956]
MQIDDESRKQLAKFWRRKLWLGIAVIGTLGIAAWRISSVQARYDDVLVQESRNLPDKVYQELIQEIRQGIPNQPIFWETDDFKKNQTCSSINLLGSLGDRRAIPELKKLMEDEMNHVRNCGGNILDKSIYLAAALALSNFEDENTFSYLKQSLASLPSSRILNLQREFHRRERLILKQPTFNWNDKQNVALLKSPFPRFLEPSEHDTINQKIIRSLQFPGVVDENRAQKYQQLESKALTKQQKEQLVEELFISNFVQLLFQHQQNNLLDIAAQYGSKGNLKAFETLLSLLPKSTQTLTPFEKSTRQSILNRMLGLSAIPQFRPSILKFLRSQNFQDNDFANLYCVALAADQTGQIASELLLKRVNSGKLPEFNDGMKSCKGDFPVNVLVNQLTPLLSDRNSNIRNSAASALGFIGDPSAIPAVLQAFKKLPRYSFKDAPLENTLDPDLFVDGKSYKLFLKVLRELGYSATLADTWNDQEKQDAIVVLKKALDQPDSPRTNIDNSRAYIGYCRLASALADLGISDYLESMFCKS